MAGERAGGPDEAELVLDARAEHGEGPLWYAAENVLVWVDIARHLVHLYDPARGDDRAIDVGQPVSAVAPRAAGGLVVALQEGYAALDTASGHVELIAPVEKVHTPTRMNDGKCDSAGRFWAGTMALNQQRGAGTLYRLERDHSVTAVLRHVTVPNGPAWSRDNRTMYFTDSATGGVDAYDFDPRTGAMSNQRRFVSLPSDVGVPDGMTVDADDYLWVAVWGGGAVHRYTPTGELARVVKLPVSLVSCPTFGGPDLADLYITTSQQGLSAEERRRHPHAGSLFRYRPGVMGLPPFAYQG
jgi:sugar lactone lactonase YvrE